MTPATIILAILLIAAVAFILYLAVNCIDLERELEDERKDGDMYSMQYIDLLEKYEPLAKRNAVLEDFHRWLQSPYSPKLYKITEESYTDTANQFNVVRYRVGGENMLVKNFPYTAADADAREAAQNDARDLLDALNGKIGWREDTGQSARTPTPGGE